ncbi:hypothetical protein GCM10011506_28950 [Marivirga lumbricoides]|uniref:PAS domain S-box protein n=1 Tax=Marivirga lumbricoides TaxID=1046115 RepID=A0ABQ1MMJ3_9BACT|nr:hypothetical protein GCM10011506_28950 [Marivirga lumbricoides]
MKINKAMRNLSVMGKVLLALTVFASLAVINFSIVLYYNSKQKEDDLAIETASKRKMLSQWVLLYANKVIHGEDGKKEEMEQMLRLSSAYLKVLKEGGEVPGSTAIGIQLAPAQGKQLESLMKVERLWNGFETSGLKLINASSGDGINQENAENIGKHAAEVLNADDVLISIFTEQKDARQSVFLNAMAVMLFLYLLFAFLFYRLFKKHLRRPVDEIELFATSLAEGNLNVERQYEAKNELSVIIDKLDATKQKIGKATSFAIGIGNDDYEEELEASENDQLSQALLLMRDKLTASASEDQKRRWIAEGLSEFSQMLRGDSKKDFKELASKIISELVKYVGGSQGALFLLNKQEQEEYMEMVACYAWDRNKYFSKKIDYGEGLVGQVWREADSVYLEEVPDDFIQIKSGLGDAQPKSIFIVPLKTEDKIEGVLELAFLHKMELHQKEFIEKLCESLASAFSIAKVNQNTRHLLEISQQQAEELKAQEEEMRQNMEELQATQEEMARQKKEMEVFNSAVDSSSVIVEFSREGKFAHVNQKFLDLTGYTREEIIGKSHEFYVPADKITSGSFQKLWEDIKDGSHFVRDVERLRKDGSPFWLRASYMPIYNEKGEFTRISCICFDVTKEKLHEKEMSNFTDAVDNSSIIIDFNREGKIIHINKKFMEITGYTEEEMIGKPHSYYVPKNAIKSGAFEQLWSDLSKGQHFVRDVERVKKNGEHFWLRASYMPIFDDKGDLIKISCICFDVTKEKIHEKEMNDFTNAVDNSSIIIDFNQQGKIIHVNKKFKEVTGYTEEEMIGQPHSYYVPKESIKSGAFEQLWSDLSKGDHFVRDVERVKKNGEHFWLRASYMPIFDDDGQLVKISCICFDITEEKIKSNK